MSTLYSHLLPIHDSILHAARTTLRLYRHQDFYFCRIYCHMSGRFELRWRACLPSICFGPHGCFIGDELAHTFFMHHILPFERIWAQSSAMYSYHAGSCLFYLVLFGQTEAACEMLQQLPKIKLHLFNPISVFLAHIQSSANPSRGGMPLKNAGNSAF
jgi:hypothetical protein